MAGKFRKVIEYVAYNPKATLYSAGVVGLGEFALGIMTSDPVTGLVATLGGFFTVGSAIYELSDLNESEGTDRKYHTQTDTIEETKNTEVKA